MFYKEIDTFTLSCKDENVNLLFIYPRARVLRAASSVIAHSFAIESSMCSRIRLDDSLHASRCEGNSGEIFIIPASTFSENFMREVSYG